MRKLPPQKRLRHDIPSAIVMPFPTARAVIAPDIASAIVPIRPDAALFSAFPALWDAPFPISPLLRLCRVSSVSVNVNGGTP